MTFFERLESLRLGSKLGKNDIARIAGVTPGAIGEWEKNGTIPKADVAITLSKYLNVSVEYLILGEGEGAEGMIVEGSKVQGRKIIPFHSDNNDDIVMVPFYVDIQASAGPGQEALDYQTTKPIPVLKTFLAPYNPQDVQTIEVHGDSMTKVHLFNGDVVFFIKVDDPGDGIHVISIGNKIYVKRVEFDVMGKEVRIISENDRYPPQILKGDDVNQFRVVGKVIGWLTRHPY